MSPLIRHSLALARKDLALELRTWQVVPAMALFSVIAYVLFHFGLDRDSLSGDLASGVLWVTLVLATTLAVARLFAAEREQGALDGVLMTPIDRTALWVSKAAALLAYLLALQLVALPAYAVLLLEPSLPGALPELAVVLLLADIGLAAVGALVAALAAEARARELIVPLLLLPLLVPVAIAGSERLSRSSPQDSMQKDLGRWLGILGLYDAVFVLLSVAVFDYLLED